MRFSAGEAAFEGFRVTRRHPGALLIWGLIWVVAVLAMAVTAMPLLNPVLGEVQAAMASGAQPSEAAQLQLNYASLATLPIWLVSQSILIPALYRAMRSDVRDAFGFVRLGRDELRALLALAIVGMISLAISQAGTVLVAVSGSVAPGLSMVIEVLTLLISIYVSVRLILTLPAAFERHRVDISASWRSTRGGFWPLLGLSVLTTVMAAVVMVLIFVIALPFYGASAADSGSALGAAAAAALLILAGLGMAMAMTIVSAPFMAVWLEVDPAV